jgi:hypothetical protein
VTDKTDKIYSSWIEYLNDTMCALQYASLSEDHVWTSPKTIATGANWFVNWADFPSLIAQEDYLTAHWLQYSSTDTYDYDIRVSQSMDGASWSPPFVLHNDGVAAEHGFVSMDALPDGQTIISWLDGRNTKDDSGDPHGHGHGKGGAMTLRAAFLGPEGSVNNESELDNRVCDCCQTSTAITSRGPVVAYRNRSEDEIRDIYLVRQIKGSWQEPVCVFADGWNIGGCPVNGPVVAAKGDLLAIAWFTMAHDIPRVKLSFSYDGGATFAAPVIISENDPLGRIDLLFLDDSQVLVSWVEHISETAKIMGCVVPDKEEKGESFEIVTTSATRQSGFPRLAKCRKRLYLSWTELSANGSKIATAELNFSPY